MTAPVEASGERASGRVAVLLPGVLMAFTIAAASQFISEHYNAPVMLFALLIGMAFHFLSLEGRCAPGIQFTSSRLLKIGVALLGARVTFSDLASLGPKPVLFTPLLIAATIAAGVAFSRLFGRRTRFGILTGGAVAICGASAALAIAAALPLRQDGERDTLFTVIAVTTLSTVAMVLYPIVFHLIGYDDRQIGYLIGATIHDVAQVVGAILAGLAVRFLFTEDVLRRARAGAPHLNEAAFGTTVLASVLSGIGIELVLTFLLTFAIFGTVLDSRAPRLGGLPVGLALAALVLVGYGLTFHDVIEALERNNANAGGAYIAKDAEQYLIRGEGLVGTLADIGDIVVAVDQRDGTPVYVRQLGDVQFAPMVRQGAVTRDGRGEVVAGIVQHDVAARHLLAHGEARPFPPDL